ncbi:hypothetical protein B0T10DRAFT_574214 [Thelonectria olida]|uniref:Uncharacterized protein n=1 Tax=Thelonectria olida TaxID=1576542 RepID=A0A9P8W2V7_9HYPO|nr:hypothetical protein B0T10DRAFT_574214 [Thelonectria olida]
MSFFSGLADKMAAVVAQGSVGIGATTQSELASMAQQIATQNSAAVLAAFEDDDLSESFRKGQDEVFQNLNIYDMANVQSRVTDIANSERQDKPKFAKLVGAEIAKTAACTVAMKVVQAAFAQAAQQNPAAGSQRAVTILNAIQAERAKTDPIAQEWQLWLVQHYDNRSSYGHLEVEGVKIFQFDVVQSSLNNAPDYTAEGITAALDAAKNATSGGSMDEVLAREQKYVKMLIELDSTIGEREQAMVQDGLTQHTADLVAAQQSLNI